MSVIRGQSLVVDGGEARASAFLRFAEAGDKLFKAPKGEAWEDIGRSESAAPLTYLRVELARIRSGMSDFLIRVATPNVEGVKKSNVMVTLRGSKAFSNLAGATKVAQVIAKQMKVRGDDTHAWDEANVEHLGKMLLGPLKFFSANVSVSNMKFSTEALS